jgi:hypothetical protein
MFVGIRIDMLIYHPAFDPYHCAFRGMRILGILEGIDIEVDSFRIGDFYILFPSLIAQMKLSQDLLKWRSRFSEAKNPYHFSGDQKIVFGRMRVFQLMGLRALAHNGIIDEAKLQKGTIVKGSSTWPETLSGVVKKANEQESDLMNFLRDLFMKIPFRGVNGLKARSGLLEYKYDNV